MKEPGDSIPGLEADLQASVVKGWLELVERDGRDAYRLTPKGTRHVERHLGLAGDKEPCDCD